MILQTRMLEVRDIVNRELDKLLPIPETRDARLIESMRYSAIGTGKALRPLLALTVGELLELPFDQALRIGVAIELLHTYSLIHDDLPAMDNDTLRRGKPTNHIQFDEATAILAGDALQARAFEVLTDSSVIPDRSVQAALVGELAKAAGMSGMVGGQMLDLIGEKDPLNLDEIERMQSLKTGALLYFSCVAPAIAKGAGTETIQTLAKYAQAVGLIFQITDDILDVEGQTELVGKTLGKDSEAHKSTFVSILGMDKAKQLVISLKQRGEEALNVFGDRADDLRDILTYITERKR